VTSDEARVNPGTKLSALRPMLRSANRPVCDKLVQPIITHANHGQWQSKEKLRKRLRLQAKVHVVIVKLRLNSCSQVRPAVETSR
jgi:hypothetical protein